MSLTINALAIVDLPEPDRPVKKTVNPCLWRGGCVRRSSATTSGNENHAGISAPSCRRRRSSVPEMSSVRHARLDLVLREILSLLLDIDHVLERHHRDVEFLLMLLHEVLCVVRAVERLAVAVLAGTGVVAPDDEVRAAVVLADDRVPERLARAAHAHRERQQRRARSSAPGMPQQMLVAAHAREVVDVAGLRHADDGLHQQVRLDVLRRAEGELLVRAVHRVARLERDDLAPAELLEAAREVPSE